MFRANTVSVISRRVAAAASLRPEYEAVALVGEIVRQGEGLFGQPRQPVADLAGQRREQRETDGHVCDHRGGQRGIEPVYHPHRRLGHDHRAPDGDEQQHPLGVVFPRTAEGGAEQDPAEPTHAGELGQRHIGAARSDRGDGIEQVDQVGAAAESEESRTWRRAAPGPISTRPPRRRARRRAQRGDRPRARRRARFRSGAVFPPRPAPC